MKPSDHVQGTSDFLAGSFVSIPFHWLVRCGTLGLSTDGFAVLMQIIGAMQVEHQDFLTPPELAERVGLPPHHVNDILTGLMEHHFLTVGERRDADGTVSNYFDLQPLWLRLQGAHESETESLPGDDKGVVQWFEEEFGRPLSGLEYDQIRTWIREDKHPDWMILEALREAVLSSKYSFKYIDRILFDWQRNRIRTKAELDEYREAYRERFKARSETAASKRESTGRPRDGRAGQGGKTSTLSTPSDKGQKPRDERYAAFYELYPDS